MSSFEPAGAAGDINVKKIYAAMLLSVLSGSAMGQDALAPPAGERKLFEFSADGVQIYVCKPKDVEAHKEQGLAWVFDAPDAVLFDADGKQEGKHAKGPSWTLSDGSSVEAESSAKRPSPKPDSIPCLLLKVASRQGKARCRELHSPGRYGWRRGAHRQLRRGPQWRDHADSLFRDLSIFWTIELSRPAAQFPVPHKGQAISQPFRRRINMVFILA